MNFVSGDNWACRFCGQRNRRQCTKGMGAVCALEDLRLHKAKSVDFPTALYKYSNCPMSDHRRAYSSRCEFCVKGLAVSESSNGSGCLVWVVVLVVLFVGYSMFGGSGSSSSSSSSSGAKSSSSYSSSSSSSKSKGDTVNGYSVSEYNADVDRLAK